MQRRQFLDAAAALSGLPVSPSAVAADGGDSESSDDDNETDYYVATQQACISHRTSVHSLWNRCVNVSCRSQLDSPSGIRLDHR